MTVLVWSAGALVSSILVWMIVFLVVKGLPALRGGLLHRGHEQGRAAHPRRRRASTRSSARSSRSGSRRMVVVPVAVLTAVYLQRDQRAARHAGAVRRRRDERPAEHRRRPARLHGLGRAATGSPGVAGAAALAVLMLPTVTRASEEILRTIPDTLREGALALGRTAVAGHRARRAPDGARRAGDRRDPRRRPRGRRDRADAAHRVRLRHHEHEPVLGPAGGPPALRVEADPAARTRPQIERAWTGALVLVLLVLVLFVTARFIASRSQKKLGRAR